MIQLSSTAAIEISRLRTKSQKLNPKLRVTVLSSGCLPLSYSLSFDSEISPGDQTYPCNSITVVVSPEVLPYINGLLIDYSEDLMGGGFRFHNPNALQTCSCGNSFSMTES